MVDTQPLHPTDETLTGNDGGAFRIVQVATRADNPGPPVILLHGMFTDRRFWLSGKGIGLAAFLAEQGHPAFIVQRRGLGDSPAISQRCGLEEHLRYDLPAVQAYVSARFNEPAFWIGHSFGGLMAARGVAKTLDAQVAGLVLLASQYEIGKRMLDWPGQLGTRAITRLLGRLPARAAGLGPVDEPPAVVLDACNWVARGRRSPELAAELARIQAPILALSGAADRVDPAAGCRRFIEPMASTDKTFLVAGRDQGFECDYDHPGIVVSKPAQREIWPRIGTWLACRDR